MHGYKNTRLRCGGLTLRRLLTLTLSGGLLFMSGCMVGPDYQQVKPQAQADWQAQMAKGLQPSPPQAKQLAQWWQLFEDPVLTRLEDKAIAGNLDIKTALSRLRQARLQRGISRAPLLPVVDGSGEAQQQRASESMHSNSGGDEQDYYMAGFDAAWELDVFGGIRRSVQEAQAQLEASRAGLQDVVTSLCAEVALNYIEVRTYQRRLDILKANIETQKQTYDLNRSRYQSGLIDELAVQQSLRNLEHTRSQVSRLQTGLRQAKNRLAVLLGQQPGTLKSLLTGKQGIPQAPDTVAVGIPAQAMRRRPDIRQAERQLAAQTARIGVAKADLYPKFRLLGSIGLEALESTSDFLDAQSRFWNVGPGVSWNIFQGQKLRLNIKLQTEKQRQALVAYKSAVLQAHKEIENALTAYAKQQINAQALQRTVKAAKRAEYLARDRYKAGLVNFYQVLDAQRSLLEMQDELVQSRGQVASNLARLYKALGGGWQHYQPQDKQLAPAEQASHGQGQEQQG